jgi:hypothetical protein
MLNRYDPAGSGRLLSFFSRVPGSLELAHDTPTLAYLLAHADVVFHSVQQPLRASRRLIRRRRREILGWLGFPATESWVRIMKKIQPPISLSVPRMLYLKQAAHEPAVDKLLRHCPRINYGVLRIATDQELRPLISPQTAAEIGRHRGFDRRPKAAWLLQEVLGMLELINKHERWIAKSLQHLQETHDNLIQETAGFTINRRFAFPTPTLPGAEGIEPLASFAAVREEGRQQRHCIGSLHYARAIINNELYVYLVLPPWQRATAAINHTNGCWRLRDLKGVANSAVDQQTTEYVQNWLRTHQTRPMPTFFSDEQIEVPQW